VSALFINHQTQRCGVYQMGSRIGMTLYNAGIASYLETWDLGTAILRAQLQQPRVIIYNWHPSTMPWASEMVKRFRDAKHVGLVHEIAPDSPAAGAHLFPYRMVCDPTFPADGRTVFKSVRHVPRNQYSPPSTNDVVTIGSFGFAVGGKMFATVVHAVGAEFPGARVRLRIPSAHYGDDAGSLARSASESARRVTIGGVYVEVEHDFLDEDQLVSWLASNDMNVFFYDPNGGRGVASVIDYAIAARRPIAINDSQMFRHVKEALGCYPDRSLSDSLGSASAVEALYQQWSPERLVQDYRDMLDALA